MNISQLRTEIDEQLTSRKLCQLGIDKYEDLLIKQKKSLVDYQTAQDILQQTAREVQARVHARIAGLVSQCLSTIFDEPYIFEISFEKKRGKTEARMFFKRDGLEVDPMTASGGGCIDVAAFALRLACLMLSRPALRHILVMDEPFKFVSVRYRDRIRQMIERLSEDLHVQFIFVTHIEELKTGSVVEL